MKRVVTAYQSDAKTPLERLARLAGRTTFVALDEGRGGLGLTTSDLAHAVGCVHDPLAQAMTMSVAAQSLLNWPTVCALALPDVMAHARSQRASKVALVLRQAYADVVSGGKSRCGLLARRVHMRHQDCRDVYRQAVSMLESAAWEGAREACARLA